MHVTPAGISGRISFQLEFVFRDAKQFTGLTHCQARNRAALSFAFNASLSSVNLARAFARQQGMDLSVGSTKTLLQNAVMVDRFIAMSGKSPNMRFNNTDVKSNFYSTLFEPWRNFYKINELLSYNMF